MTPEQMFLSKLTAMAKFTGAQVPAEIFTAYDRALGETYGYEKACRALDTIMETLTQRSPFPSIADIKEILDPRTDAATESTQVAGLIAQAVTQVGPYRHKEFREFVGEIGWIVVNLSGGVDAVCHLEMRDMAFHQSLWTKLALAQIVRARAGLRGQVPVLPEGKQEVKQLAGLLKEMPK